MGTRERRRDERDEEEAERPPPVRPPLLDTVDDLQRRAGNRAVAQVLAREPAAGWSFDPRAPTARPGPGDLPAVPGAPDLNLPADYVERRQAATLAKVGEYVDRERGPLTERIRQGLSIAEVLDAVVRAVPEAREVPLETLAAHVRRLFAPLEIPAHRQAFDTPGVRAEIAAQAKLALPSLAGDPRIGVGGPGGNLKVGLSGVTAGLTRGGVELEAEVGWSKDVGFTARRGNVQVELHLEPPSGDGPAHWEVVLQFPGGDGLVPTLDALPKVFGAAERGVRGAAGELLRRGDGGLRTAAAQLGDVKSAVEAVSALAATPSGPRVGVKAEGQGPETSIQATVTVSF